MLVRDYMTVNPISLSPGEDVKAAFNILSDSRIRQAPVVEEGKLIGIVTDRDLRMALVQDFSEPGLSVGSIMTPDPSVVTEDSKLADAGEIIIQKKVNAVPVVSEKGALTGIITSTDILSGVLNILKDPKICSPLITK